jgi:hypothetical protein
LRQAKRKSAERTPGLLRLVPCDSAGAAFSACSTSQSGGHDPRRGRECAAVRTARVVLSLLSPSTLLYVLDYEAMGRTGVKPRRLHRTDCSHPDAQTAWRKATQEELKTLRPCKDCQNRE